MHALVALALGTALHAVPTKIAVAVRTEERAGVSDVGLPDASSSASTDPMAPVVADVMVAPAFLYKDKDGAATWRFAYSPQLVFRLTAGNALPLVLHTANARIGFGGPRWTTYANAGIQAGELDFSRAVRQMKLPGSVPDGTSSLDAVPYLMSGVTAGGSVRVLPHWTLGLDGGASLSGASAAKLRTAFPLVSRPWIQGTTTHRIARFDDLAASLQLESVVFSTGASYAGVQPTGTWTHTFEHNGSTSVRAGALFTSSTPFPGKPGVLGVRPIVDLRAGTSAGLGFAHTDSSVFAGVGPYYDPFTATLDERSSVGFSTSAGFGRIRVTTIGAWMTMLNWARPEYGLGYLGGRGAQSDHIAMLDTKVEWLAVGPLSFDAGVQTMVRWDEPSWPQPTNPGLEVFGVLGMKGGMEWPKRHDRDRQQED